MSKLPTDPYKGVRDFYPEDMYVENYMFDIWRKSVKKYGYEEYSASPLESAEIYKTKTSDEIVNEQTYTFKDRGDREVTLRPEMTPTLARMISAKRRDLGFPLRLFSIPNLFRYEQPQRGRLREHYQLNFDLFGIKGLDAETEIIKVASEILHNFGAKDSDFRILINSRKLLNDLFSSYEIKEEDIRRLTKIIDKKDKIDASVYEEGIKSILGDKTKDFMEVFGSNQKIIKLLGEDNPNVKNLISLIEKLQGANITNAIFTPTLMRGFDYYTDIVFEVFDTNPENRRSIFGGGRYDGLTELFDSESVAAVGIAVGDVTMRDFLETHGLLPKYKPNTHIFVASLEESAASESLSLAERLRGTGLNIATDTTDKKVTDKLKNALKLKIPYFLAVGAEEIKSKSFRLKNLLTSDERNVSENEIAGLING